MKNKKKNGVSFIWGWGLFYVEYIIKNVYVYIRLCNFSVSIR